MARVRHTDRPKDRPNEIAKKGSGNKISKLQEGTSRKTSTPTRLTKISPRQCHLDEHISVLLELKKYMRRMTATIPRLPFQCIVRSICEQIDVCFR